MTLTFALMVGARPAAAQSAIEDEFSVQRFDVPAGPRNFLVTRGARMDGPMTWSGGAFVNYAYEPFVLEYCVSRGDCDGGGSQPDVKIVENLVTADALAALSPLPRLQVGVKVPVTWVDGQGITEEGTGNFDGGLSAVGLGDLQVEGKYRLLGEARDPYVAGAALFATAPLGTLTADGSYVGDPTPTVGLRGIFDAQRGRLSYGANLAAVYRGEGRVGSTELGPFEFRYSAAAGLQVGPSVRLLVDVFGATPFNTKSGANALEADVGVQVAPYGSAFVLTAGAGTGIVRGVGTPTVRAFLGLMYTGEAVDADGDGIDDGADQCPTIAEDRDGRDDADGCPDLDDDGDGIEESVDRCPNAAEDVDDFQDTDGCPDPDNDADGVPDSADACPAKPETKNGFEDEDGCPDQLDRDADGVTDERDQCKDDKEDTDGFQDEDGCPDPDNDADGVPDQQDECSDEPETKNGFEDEDGCPDEAPPAPPARSGPARSR